MYFAGAKMTTVRFRQLESVAEAKRLIIRTSVHVFLVALVRGFVCCFHRFSVFSSFCSIQDAKMRFQLQEEPQAQNDVLIGMSLRHLYKWSRSFVCKSNRFSVLRDFVLDPRLRHTSFGRQRTSQCKITSSFKCRTTVFCWRSK
jgi:hypothetical protein